LLLLLSQFTLVFTCFCSWASSLFSFFCFFLSWQWNPT
jgi:hypothetical protein